MDRQFIIVGAQRSGTSYLHTVLDEHPEIEMARPLAPEPKYFLRADFASMNRSDYESCYFGRKAGSVKRGEKSTSYMEFELAARRIAGWYPEAQIIFILRHPAARAVSNYCFSRQNGLEQRPMAQAFAEEEERRDDYDHRKLSASPFAYLKRGHYLDHIRMFERYFERRQLILLIKEELTGNLGRIRALYRTLGVTDEFSPPSLGSAVNSAEEAAERPSAEVLGFLQSYFAERIAALEGYLGRPIMVWRDQSVPWGAVTNGADPCNPTLA